MTAEEIRTRGESRLADVRDRLARLEADAPKDSDALLRDVDELQLAMTNVASQLGVLVNVHPDLDAREACEKIQLEATTLNVRISQSRPIYDALSKLDLTPLDGPARRAVELTLRDMRRAGVHLDEAKRTKAQEIRQRITTLSQSYSRNLRDDVRTVELPASSLEGTPTDYRTAHPADANGKVKVTTDP